MTSYEYILSFIKEHPEIEHIVLKFYSTHLLECDWHITPEDNFKNMVEESESVPIVLARLTRYDSEDQKFLELFPEAEDFESNFLACLTPPDGFACAICSLAQLKGKDEVFHIPMLDFRCPATQPYIDVINHFYMQELKQYGKCFDSGQALHYYGNRLLDEAQFMRFLHRSLFLYPLVDVRHIAHRIKAEFGSLRLNATQHNPIVPYEVS